MSKIDVFVVGVVVGVLAVTLKQGLQRLLSWEVPKEA